MPVRHKSVIFLLIGRENKIMRHPRGGGGGHYWLGRVCAAEQGDQEPMMGSWQGMDFSGFFEQEAFTL